MITHKDQIDFFSIISRQLSRDITCYAFGGNAMMFYGYKDKTKDVDLLFERKEDRNEFIRIIEKLGFNEISPVKIYISEKLKDKNKPVMYTRSDYRFDLFVKKIFRTKLSEGMKEDVYAVHDFKDKYNLRIKVLRKEHLVLLKAITERQNDFDDIVTILKKEKSFDWQYLIDEVIWQFKHGDSWILLDIEKVMKELKEYVFIENKYVKQLYGVKDGKE
jgi:hypothetical protein